MAYRITEKKREATDDEQQRFNFAVDFRQRISVRTDILLKFAYNSIASKA